MRLSALTAVFAAAVIGSSGGMCICAAADAQVYAKIGAKDVCDVQLEAGYDGTLSFETGRSGYVPVTDDAVIIVRFTPSEEITEGTDVLGYLDGEFITADEDMEAGDELYAAIAFNDLEKEAGKASSGNVWETGFGMPFTVCVTGTYTISVEDVSYEKADASLPDQSSEESSGTKSGGSSVTSSSASSDSSGKAEAPQTADNPRTGAVLLLAGIALTGAAVVSVKKK